MKFARNMRSGDCRCFIAGVAVDAGRLGGRRPGWRRPQFGFEGNANLFRAAEHIDGAGYGAPFNRTVTQPGSPGIGATTGGGFFNSPGRGLLGGLAAGFLGAGLLGMLFGGGMFSGLGGLSSILGLILQIGLIVIVVRMAMSWWQRRHARAGLCRCCGRLRCAVEHADRDRVSDWDRAARRSRSFQPITKLSNDCSARFRPRGRARMSPDCIPWRRPKWCRISPAISRPTRPAIRST